MISYLGNFTEDATVYIMFNTFTSNDPSASCTITNFVNTDVHIHKDDGLTQRNNAAGITVSVDFDGITGSHMVKIDTSDNTVAGFWVVGHEYFVRIEGTTIDGATINSVVGQFSIENRHNEVDVVKWLGQACAAVTVNGVPEVDVTHLAGVAQSLTDLKDLVDTGYDPSNHKVQGVVLADTVTTNSDMRGTDSAALATALSTHDGKLDTVDLLVDTLIARLTAARAGYLDNLSAGAVALNSGVDLTKIHGVALTETIDGYLAAAFTKLFDVATPLLVASDVMRGTESAALAATALTDVTWTDAKAAFLNHSIATVDGNVDTLLTRITAAVALASVCTETRLAELDDANLPTDVSNVKSETALIVADTNELQTDWEDGGRLDLLIDRLIAANEVEATTVTGATSSTIFAATGLLDDTDDHYNDGVMVFTSGANRGQPKRILNFTGATKEITVSAAFETTPSIGDSFVITTQLAAAATAGGDATAINQVAMIAALDAVKGSGWIQADHSLAERPVGSAGGGSKCAWWDKDLKLATDFFKAFPSKFDNIMLKFDNISSNIAKMDSNTSVNDSITASNKSTATEIVSVKNSVKLLSDEIQSLSKELKTTDSLLLSMADASSLEDLLNGSE